MGRSVVIRDQSLPEECEGCRHLHVGRLELRDYVRCDVDEMCEEDGAPTLDDEGRPIVLSRETTGEAWYLAAWVQEGECGAREEGGDRRGPVRGSETSAARSIRIKRALARAGQAGAAHRVVRPQARGDGHAG